MTTAHLFCRVIDNHGDLGVCWRLARQLQAEQGLDVTLLVDDLDAFRLLAPALDTTSPVQPLGALTLRHWIADVTLPEPADLVIEGFACELPETYVRAMAARARPPTWINLEYLSAEGWVAGCHRLPSVHPRTGLTKHFWFPGFTPRTGGLLRETGLIDTLAATTAREMLGIDAGDRLITLFCYPQPALPGLLQALAADSRATTLVTFAGKSLDSLSQACGHPLAVGDAWQQGSLAVRALPLLPHGDYDALLAAADLNLVRGEDSLVRAHWAGQALLWHIYPQDEAAHLDKLDAFLAAATPLPDDWREAMRHWNGVGTADWARWLDRLPVWQAALEDWRDQLLAQPDLATQLMRFHADRVESRPT